MTDSQSMPSLRRLDLHYMLMQAGFWAMFAAICAYQAALLRQRGFTNGQVGIIMSVRCLAGIFCQPLLGGFADRHPEVPLRRIVVLSMLAAFAAGLWLLFQPGMGYGATLFVFAVIGGLEVSSYPLMDAMAIQYINAGVPIRYSLGRGMGSMAYALLCVWLGVQVGRWGVESVLITHSALVVLEILLVAAYPVFPAQKLPAREAAARPQSSFSLLRSHPAFALMLAAVFFEMTGVLPLSNFLVNVVESRGGQSAQLGVALFLMAAFELPAAFLFTKLYRRVGSGRLLVVSALFCALKGVGLLLAWSFPAVLAVQPLQMLGYGLFTPASVYFVNESVPPADRVRGQTLMMVASNGLGGVAGNAMAGRLLDAAGVNGMLWFCVGCCLVSIALSAAAIRGKKAQN